MASPDQVILTKAQVAVLLKMASNGREYIADQEHMFHTEDECDLARDTYDRLLLDMERTDPELVKGIPNNWLSTA